MRVVLVDDEPLILAHFENLLKKIDDIEIVGTFLNPYEALENIEKIVPDIVFLDIEMPGITGIELAELIQSRSPEIQVVFITAHSEYAVKAFDLNAVDYLLKPIQIERLSKTIARLREGMKTLDLTTASEDRVCCFQHLHFYKKEVLNVRWRTTKAKELFAFLLQYYGKPVSKTMLLDLFWPETDFDRGLSYLYTTVYQIRKMLRDMNFKIKITSLDNNYVLDLNGTMLDVKDWEKKVTLLPNLTLDTLQQHSEVLDLYRGDYLAEEGYSWAESERERVRNLWLSHAVKIADFLVTHKKYTRAIGIYQRVQVFFPLVEDYYFILMQLYDKVGDRAAVEKQYDSLVSTCKQEYGTEPHQTIRTWYERWRQDSL